MLIDVWTEIHQADRYLAKGDLESANLRYTNTYNRHGNESIKKTLAGAVICARSAFCLLFSGEIAGAKDLAERSLSTLRSLGKDNQMVAVLPAAVLAKTLMSSNDFGAAKRAFDQAQFAVRGHELKDKNEALSFAVSFFAEFLSRTGDRTKQAKSFYENAAKSWKAFGQPGLYNRLAMLDQLADLEDRNANYQSSEDILVAAIDLLQSSPNHSVQTESRLRYHLSEILWHQKNFFESLKERALALAQFRGLLK